MGHISDLGQLCMWFSFAVPIGSDNESRIDLQRTTLYNSHFQLPFSFSWIRRTTRIGILGHRQTLTLTWMTFLQLGETKVHKCWPYLVCIKDMCPAGMSTVREDLSKRSPPFWLYLPPSSDLPPEIKPFKSSHRYFLFQIFKKKLLFKLI